MCFDPIVVFFLKSKFFHFQKKLQVLADPVVVNFFENALDPTLVIFLTFLKKITTTGSSANFLSPKPNGQGFYIQKDMNLDYT